jgi:hypothetical protein
MAPRDAAHLAVQRVREALERAGCDPRGRDHDFVARCPCHDDRHPSLQVSEGADGRALITCFAQCATEGVLAALGLGWGDLFPPDPLDGPHWRPVRDRYIEIAGKVSQAKIDAYDQRRRLRDANVLLDVLVQLIGTGQDFTGSVAFTCPWCQSGPAWLRRTQARDQGCTEDEVLGALAGLDRAAA